MKYFVKLKFDFSDEIIMKHNIDYTYDWMACVKHERHFQRVAKPIRM